MILLRLRHIVRKARIERARARGQHERALALLKRELYGDFYRTAAQLHLEMARELAALGRPDEALSALKLALDNRLDEEALQNKRLLWDQLLPALGKRKIRS